MRSQISAYIELSKLRLVGLVLITGTFGYFLSGGGELTRLNFLMLLIGMGCASIGAAALNQYLEKDVDSKMERTLNRPLVRGIISPQKALEFGIVFVLFGVTILWFYINLLTSFLILLASFIYCLVYTPAKKYTWLNTYIGAIPGAIPTMAGWTAATGSIDAGAWALFLILFVWQHPHFYAIAWIFREDYKKAGIKMLPVVYPDGKLTFFHIIFFSVLLIPVSTLPHLIGLTGITYLCGAIFLSLGFLFASLLVCFSHTTFNAKRLFHASIIYLPSILLLIILDKGIGF